jgi:hypothetical protein
MADNPQFIWRLEQESNLDGNGWRSYGVRYYENPKHPALKDKITSTKVANHNHRQLKGGPDVFRSRLYRYKLDLEEDTSGGPYATQVEN